MWRISQSSLMRREAKMKYISSVALRYIRKSGATPTKFLDPQYEMQAGMSE